ncbi:MAG: hypothetical protein ACPGRH_00320 [Alphaproteobacteria bacterium]
MTEPRTNLNRILIAAITLMTIAIFGLGAAIVWRLFLSGDSGKVVLSDTQRIDIGTAAIEYRVSEGCKDEIIVEEGAIELRLFGTGCAGLQIIELTGNVSLIRE